MIVLNKPSNYLKKKRTQHATTALAGFMLKSVSSISRSPWARLLNSFGSGLAYPSLNESIAYDEGIHGEEQVIKTLQALDDWLIIFFSCSGLNVAIILHGTLGILSLSIGLFEM